MQDVKIKQFVFGGLMKENSVIPFLLYDPKMGSCSFGSSQSVMVFFVSSAISDLFVSCDENFLEILHSHLTTLVYAYLYRTTTLTT
ncbi:hypothetical protein WN944_018424 [Citrus x changshan-huyou]|uniref:Uncharacterized protein n=1 Tax=Citrus x changshan-huyou TaxID=2935761 RepID=A0AAP0LZS9_9ROSI